MSVDNRFLGRIGDALSPLLLDTDLSKLSTHCKTDPEEIIISISKTFL